MKAFLLSFIVFGLLSVPGFTQVNTEVDSIRELKDQVLDRKLQLNLVKELIRKEKLDTQYPVIKFNFKNNMSSRYLLLSLEYFVDESKVYSYFNDISKLASAEEANLKKIDSYDLNLSPGLHNVRVVAIYKGNDTGVFSYLSDYKVRSEGSMEVSVKKGQDMELNVTGFEKGGLFTDFKERPSVEISVK